MTKPAEITDLEQKLAELAHNYELMRRGYWKWPDGKAHLDRNNMPIVNKRALIRSIGWSEDSHSRYDYFEDERFLNSLAQEQARWDANFYDLISRLNANPASLGAAMIQDLAIRYASCPGAFSATQLARLGQQMIKLALVLRQVPLPLRGGDDPLQAEGLPMLGAGDGSVPPAVMRQATAFLESGDEPVS
jgi:hypothetical protein